MEQSQLTEGQVEHIRRFCPSYTNEREVPASLDNQGVNLETAENPSVHMHAFITQMRDARNEQQEILSELTDLRIKVEQNIDFADEKDMQTLKDDVQFFTAENLELRLKIKSLVIHNLELSNRIKEQNQLLAQTRRKTGEDERSLIEEEGIFNLSVISIGHSQRQAVAEKKEEQKEQQSLVLSEEGQINLFNDSSVEHKDHLGLNSSPQKSIQIIESLSILEADNGGEETERNLDTNRQNVTNVTQLEIKLKDANEKIQALMGELKETTQRAERLQLEHGSRSTGQIQEEQNASMQSTESYKNTLQHVKGTLIMYLKKTPVVDLNNEILLKIIFSMMHFTKQEIEDLKEVRDELPVYKIDHSKTKKAKKDREVSANKKASSSNQQSLTSSRMDDGSHGTIYTDPGLVEKQGALPQSEHAKKKSSETNAARQLTPGKQPDISPQKNSDSVADKLKSNFKGLFKKSLTGKEKSDSESARPSPAANLDIRAINYAEAPNSTRHANSPKIQPFSIPGSKNQVPPPVRGLAREAPDDV